MDPFIAFFGANPEKLFTVFLLGLARLLPIIALTPFLGAQVLPTPAKIGLGIALSCLLFPLFFHQTETAVLGWNTLFLLCFLKELLVGAIIGFLAAVPFYICQMAGIVIDNQRGSANMTGQDMITSSQSSMIGILLNFLAIVIFFHMDGPFVFLDAVTKSYHLLPIDQMIPSAFFRDPGFWGTMIGLLHHIAAISTQLAAPVLLTILMTNTFLGIVNRLAPQVQISFLGQGLSAFFADFILLLAWFFILPQIGKICMTWMIELTNLVDHI